MSLTPDFFEPDSEFDSWRDYRDKRRRRTFYFLSLLLALILIALSLPTTYAGVFGDTSSYGNGRTLADGQDGTDGVDGRNGINGKDGVDGEQGLPGLPGTPGEPGSPGAPGESGAPGEPGGPGVGSGQGLIRVGTCDDAVGMSIRSRILSGEFYLRSITVSEIADTCIGQNMDVYILNAAGDEVFASFGNLITTSTLTLEHALFSTDPISASLVEQIAIEIAN